MKLEAIIKELEKLCHPFSDEELNIYIAKDQSLNDRLLRVVKCCVKSIPLPDSTIAELTGISRSSLGHLNRDSGCPTSSSELIKTMFKLGYDVEIKFTRNES